MALPGLNVRRGREPLAARRRTPQQGACPSELHGLIHAIGIAGRRDLINAFLRDWMIWLSWTLAGFLLIASLSKRLMTPLALAGIFFVLGAIVAIVRARWIRPSPYGMACRLDSAAGLLDRVPTALHLAAAESPDAMTLRQRKDALERLARVDARALFPIRLPSFARRTLVLALVVSAFLVYRIHHGPPIPALVRTAVNSRVQKAVLAPIEVAVKRDLMELIQQEPGTGSKDSASAETIPGLRDAKNSGDVSPPDDEPDTADAAWGQDSRPSDQQPSEPGDLQPGQSVSKGQPGSKSEGARQEQADDGSQQSPATQNAGRGSNGQQPETQQEGNSQSSGAKSALQALKDFVKSIRGQESQQSPPPAEYAPRDRPPSAEASSETGNSHEHPAQGDTFKGDSDRRDASAISDPKKPGGGAGNGSTAVSREDVKSPPPMAAKMVRDRVDLEANDFRQEGRLRTSAGPGVAQMPLREINPQPLAAIKGAEQENIPARYRLYVQRYFEREDGGK